MIVILPARTKIQSPLKFRDQSFRPLLAIFSKKSTKKSYLKPINTKIESFSLVLSALFYVFVVKIQNLKKAS